MAIAPAVGPSTAHPRPRHQVGQAVRPVVPPRPRRSPRSRIANLWLPPHLARHQHQRALQQPPLAQVFQQRRKTAVKLREQRLLQAAEVVAVRVPPPGTRTFQFLGSLSIGQPIDRHERHLRLHQPTGQQQALPVHGPAIALPHRRGLAFEIKRLPGRPPGQQRKCPFLVLPPRSRPRPAIPLAGGAVQQRQQVPAIPQRLHRRPLGQRQCGSLKPPRLVRVGEQVERVVLDSQSPGELPRPNIRRRLGDPGERDCGRERPPRRQLRPHHRAHERPVIGLLPTVAPQRDKARVQGVPGQVVVVGEVRVGGVGPIDGVQQREVLRLAGQQGQVFTEANSRGRRLDRLEFTTDLRRGLGLEIPGVEMRGATTQKKQQGRAGATE